MLQARLTEDQAGILLSLVDSRRVAVKASHAIGKTFCAAIAANWWYDCWDEHIVYITAPTWPQCLGLTFKQIKLMRRAHGLPGTILETGWVRDEDPLLAPGHFVRALNAESGEGFQGEHTAPILQIYEESVGVPPYIWEAGDGLMTAPECRLLAIANPTDEATPFGQACASPLFRVISVSALDHPNVRAELAGERPPFPKAVRLTWLEEMLEKECERTGSPDGDAFEFPPGSGRYWLPNAVFQGRVLGEFPSQADQQVIPRGWLKGLPVLQPGLGVEIGCDVARHGTDRTTIAARSGPCLLSLREVRRYDLATITGELKRLARELAPAFHCEARAIPIRVDVTGGLGAGPADALREAGFNAIDVNSSSKALDVEQYPNRRSELWFGVRERARTRNLDLSRLPRELRDRLERELSTPAWKVNSKGQKVVELKDDIKKRLGESPDLADAVNLAYDRSGANWREFLDEQEDAEPEARESEALSVRW